MKQVRLYLSEESIRQAKLLTLILGRDDHNQVIDDCIKIGIAYMNERCKLELAAWSDSLKLFDLQTMPDLKIIKGRLPALDEG